MARRRLVICKVCNREVRPNTGIPKKNIHRACAEKLPCDLIIIRGTSRIEVRTPLCSKKQLQRIARAFVSNYNTDRSDKYGKR